MIRTTFAVTALVTLSACAGGFQIPDFRGGGTVAPAPAPVVAPIPTPQPVPRTAKERLVSAIENNGCQLTATNVSTVLTEATIGQQELMQLAPQLEAEGRAEVAGDGAIRVKTDTCV